MEWKGYRCVGYFYSEKQHSFDTSYQGQLITFVTDWNNKYWIFTIRGYSDNRRGIVTKRGTVSRVRNKQYWIQRFNLTTNNILQKKKK